MCFDLDFMSQNQMDESEKLQILRSELEAANKTINSLRGELHNANVAESKQWKKKYHDLNQELKNALNRENELQCLMDEGNIKLKSAKREIKYLEQLVAQNEDKSDNQIINKQPIEPHIKPTSDVHELLQKDAMSQNAESICAENHFAETMKIDQYSEVKQRRNSIGSVDSSSVHNALANKYEKLELDLKKRLKIQAMLETDTRKLTYHTKQFFNQLNQQKSQTSEVCVNISFCFCCVI